MNQEEILAPEKCPDFPEQMTVETSHEIMAD